MRRTQLRAAARHAIIAVFKATGIRLSELACLRYDPGDPRRSDIDLWQREITVRGKGGKDRIVKNRIVKIGHQAARSLDRYLRARGRHAQAWRNQLWLGTSNREPLTAAGIYQMIARRGRQCGVAAHPHRFRHHFSHTWLDRGGPEGDLGAPQMDERGRVLARKRLPEGVAGMARLHELIGEQLGQDADDAEVIIGIETDRGPWVAALVAAGYTVYGVNPLQASRYRQHHGVSGAKSDRGDAHMLADMVRTDSHQLRAVAGDSPGAGAGQGGGACP